MLKDCAICLAFALGYELGKSLVRRILRPKLQKTFVRPVDKQACRYLLDYARGLQNRGEVTAAGEVRFVAKNLVE